jgi:hypothetical protein
MNSSSDEEDDSNDILSMISGTPPSKRPKLIGSILRSVLSVKQPCGDDFEIDIPTIFQVRGTINDSINKTQIQINNQLHENELKRENEYTRVKQVKSQFLKELNDNGSKGMKLFTANDTDLLDRFVNSEKFGELDRLVRHFYFVQIPGNASSIDTSIPFCVNLAFLNQLPNQISKIKPFFFQFINYCIVTFTNLNHLSKVNKFLRALLDQNTKIDITGYKFIQSLDAIGANTEIIQQQHLPLKLYQLQSNGPLFLLRALIVFKGYFLTKASCEKEVYKAFICVICDFNINEYSYNDLVLFVEENFVYFTNHELLYDMISKITSYEYGKENEPMVNYELLYHVFKVLFDSVSDTRLIEGFFARFLTGEQTYTTSTILKLLKSLESDFVGEIKENVLFEKYYRICCIQYLIHPYENHINTNITRANYSQEIRQQNTARLIKLKSGIDRLKRNYEHGFGATISTTYSHKTSMLIGTIYETLSHLANKIDAHLLIINDDMFYSERASPELT